MAQTLQALAEGLKSAPDSPPGIVWGGLMHKNMEHAVRQSSEARRRAGICVSIGVRDQWLMIAEMWDDLASSYEQFQKVRDSSLSG
jgi:hypothetical protein